MTSVPILVGEQNPHGDDPRFALYPLPENSAGGRLCSKVLGMSRFEYMRGFIRKNLLGPGKWDAKEARRTAGLIMLGAGPGARLILCGARVCAAFDIHVADFEMEARGAQLFLRLPHTSGRNRTWNDPASYERARGALRAFLPPALAALVGSADGPKKAD